MFDAGGTLVATARTETANWCHVTGLQPDTRYSYEVAVNDEIWAEGERYDWQPGSEQGLVKAGGTYVNRFRTHPAPDQPLTSPVSFAVIGDFGVGIEEVDVHRSGSARSACARTCGRRARRPLRPHDRRQHLRRRSASWACVSARRGDEDDDWFFTFFQPYRYCLNRIPVYPCIGNHDTAETEDRDDREQVLDNFFLRERMATDEAAGRRRSILDLFYRVRFGADVEFVCLDTSKEQFFSRGTVCSAIRSIRRSSSRRCDRRGRSASRGAFRSATIRRICAGPHHHNTDGHGTR